MPSLTETKQQDIAEFLADLDGLGTKGIRERCKRVVKRLLGEHTLATAHAELTFYRNAAKEDGGFEATKALIYLRLSDEDQAARNSATKAAVSERRSAQLDVSKRLFVAAAKRALVSQDWREIAVGIAALTGRRTFEVCCSGSFSVVSDSSLLFDGQAKTRQADGTNQGPYAIPCLGKAGKIVVAAWLRLREIRPDLRDLDGHQFHDVAGSKITDATRRTFGAAFDRGIVKTKDLRAAYAAICYQQVSAARTKKGRGISVIEYYAQILGHKLFTVGQSGGDLTAASYDYVRVTK